MAATPVAEAALRNATIELALEPPFGMDVTHVVASSVPSLSAVATTFTAALESVMVAPAGTV